jgi:hypothetical protein
MDPLKQEDDDIQKMLTDVYRETGYKLSRKDPIITMYVMQKKLNHDFFEKQTELFESLHSNIVPAINMSAEAFEKKKNELTGLAKRSAGEIIRSAGDNFINHVQNVLVDSRSTITSYLDSTLDQIRTSENEIMPKIWKEHRFIKETVEAFRVIINRFLIGVSVLFLIGLAVMVYMLW